MRTGTTVGGDGPSVLEDPTGRRAKWLRRAGRFVSLLFLAWLLAIVLGGLGLIPVAGIPFTHILRPSQGPPALVRLPQPQQPSASDLRPAVPAKVFADRAAGSHGKSATASGQTKKSTTSTVSHGKSATAPGQTKKSTTSTVSHGKSATAPGQTKTTSTSKAASKKP